MAGVERRWIEGEKPPASGYSYDTGTREFWTSQLGDPDAGRRFNLRFWFVEVEGRWELVGLRVYSPDLTPISATDIRALGWGQLIDSARPGETWFARSAPGEITVYTDRDYDPVPENVMAEPEHFVSSKPKRAGGRKPKYGRDHFEEVARVYRLAYSNNRTPTRAVARHFGATPTQAAKWVARARRMDLLPGTSRGKARAVPPKRRDNDRGQN
jgi:hypothetical protein